MLQANASTVKFVLDSQKLAIKTTHARRCSNVQTVKRIMHRTTKSAVITRGNMIFNI